MKHAVLVFMMLFVGGCTVTPTPVNKLMGFSNPTLHAKVTGYGVLDIPTDFDGDFIIDKKPDNSLHLEVHVKSNASTIDKAEGERAVSAKDIILANIAGSVAQNAANNQTAGKALDLANSVATAGLPMLGPLLTPGPAPSGSPANSMIETLIERAIERRMGGPVAPPP